MKKMIKMSLIASVAIAGLTTTASATAMEDSIKNTDLSGFIRYRYTNGKSLNETNKYKTVFVTKSKVNDMVTAKLKVAGEGTTDNTTGDADPVTANIKEANFIFNLGGNTVIAGKQGLVTPFADAGDQQGSGIVGLFPVGPVTLAAGWYTNTDATALGNDIGSHNIGALAVIGAAGPVNYSVWYAKISEGHAKDGGAAAATANGAATNYAPAVAGSALANIGAKAINVNVSGKFGPVSVEVNHASVAYDNLAKSDQEQTRLVVGANAGPVALTVGYVKTGDEGGDTTLGDPDSKSNFNLENITASGTTDASIWYLGAKAPVGPITIGLEHLRTSDVNGQVAGDLAAKETKLSAAYAMSKNFTISAFATVGETETSATTETENDMTRLEMKYTF